MNKPSVTFKEFISIVDQTYLESSFVLRYGQTIMNVLYNVWEDKHKSILGSEYDCFYDDGKVNNTILYLEKEWTHD